MMLEAARILASVAVIFLIVASVAWANPLARPPLRPLSGSAVANGGNLQIAAILLLAAVGLSAVGALLATAGWLAP
jgi:hypothetical protein